MNLNDLSYQNNFEKINRLNKNGYMMQTNKNEKLFSKNNLDGDENKAISLNSYRTYKNFRKNSLNQVDNDMNSKSNLNNDRLIFNYNNKRNKQSLNKIYKAKDKQNLNKIYKIKDNEFVYNIAMNNLNKYKDNLVNEDENTQIYNQIINNKYNNNIINYCLFKPKKSKQNYNKSFQIKKNNSHYKLEDDIQIHNEHNSPLPDPIPIRITKYSSYINQTKKPSLSLNNNDNNFNNNIRNNSIKNYRNSFNNNNINNETSSNFTEHLLLNKNLSDHNMNYNNSNNGEKNICTSKDSKLLFVLKKLDLLHLIHTFEINYISFNDLFLLSKEDLLEMKIPIGSRNKLMFFIQEYKKIMKNCDFEELSYFFNLYNNYLSFITDNKMADNNPPSSTRPTTINDFSYRNNGTSSLNHNNKKNNLENTKESFSQINNFSSLNSSYHFKKLSEDKTIYERNKSDLKNNKNISFLTLQTNDNNSKNNNQKNVLTTEIKKENLDNNPKNIIKSISNNKKRSRPFNQNLNFGNSLIKLIEDSQSSRTYSIVNGQLVSGIRNENNSIDKNDINNINIYDISKENINNRDIKDYKNKKDNNNKYINKNRDKKAKINKKINKNTFKSKSASLLNKKPKNKNKINQSINDKIIENFNNLNDEVEIFQNECMKRKKDSCIIENKIRTLLTDRHSSNTIHLLKQQIKNIKNSIKLEDLKNRKDKSLNYINKDFILKNIGKKINNASIKNNNNLSNNRKNTIIYELNIEKNKNNK